MRIAPSAQTKVLAGIALVIAMGALIALVTGASGAANVLLVAMLPAVPLMASSQYRDTRRQSGR